MCGVYLKLYCGFDLCVALELRECCSWCFEYGFCNLYKYWFYIFCGVFDLIVCLCFYSLFSMFGIVSWIYLGLKIYFCRFVSNDRWGVFCTMSFVLDLLFRLWVI